MKIFLDSDWAKRSANLFQIALYAVQINKTRAETGNESEIQHGVGHWQCKFSSFFRVFDFCTLN